MPPKVIIKQKQRGSGLKLSLFVVSEDREFESFTSEPIAVDDMAMVRVNCYTVTRMVFSVSVKRSESANNARVNLVISGDKFEKQQLPCLSNWSEKELARIPSDSEISLKKSNHLSYIIRTFTLEIDINAQDATQANQTHEGLYQDTKFTDFELCTPEGRVAVHRVVLASHSELFQKLLSDKTRKHEREFPIQGVTVQTLQQLKDYMYLGTLPLVGLPQLLLFAIHGKMNKLKEDCINKLATVVTADDLDALIDYAIQHNIPELIQAMLSLTSDSAVLGAYQNRSNKLKFCAVDFTRLALE